MKLKEKSELFLKSCLNHSNNPELFFMAWNMAKGRRIHSLVIQLVFTCNIYHSGEPPQLPRLALFSITCLIHNIHVLKVLNFTEAWTFYISKFWGDNEKRCLARHHHLTLCRLERLDMKQKHAYGAENQGEQLAAAIHIHRLFGNQETAHLTILIN